MLQVATPLVRSLFALLPALAFLLAPISDGNVAATAIGAAVALLVVAVVVTHGSRRELLALFTSSTGPEHSERCLRGAFRRQSSPDAPGRPLPRAPGTDLRLA
ncbi:DUF6412 domain-containing protein [Antrihabitans cavernicola]|uniref:Uncharacterized protein n=1 Tax=Antrihabitans cavernicola TaxID=2495913 RepID=A0A5A7S3I0_9NOCA|nr:DUF6412 domain-containing protein [Spelaeibacter cavernicola]KAA0019457.1 hypothetical protein FOY51_22700 [Spelaeibacter cavernicola]